MRAFQPGINWGTTHNPFDGEQGRALYVSPAGESAGSAIDYRHLRGLSPSGQIVGGEFPAVGDGPLGLDAHVAIAKGDDPLEWTLPPEYEDATFVINVRPHASGLELDTITGFQLVTTADGEALPSLFGVVVLISTTKLDGGGLRVVFRYVPNPAGQQPTSFEIRDTEEPGTITTVSVDMNLGHHYSVDLAGLADETEYTFAISGLNEDGETQLLTFDAVGDDSGPDIDSELSLVPK